jgi:hypothetical protein
MSDLNRRRFLKVGALGATALGLGHPASAAEPPRAKMASAFFPQALRNRARANAAQQPWAAIIRDGLTAAAEPWMKLSDEELWALMFGHTIRRSWMVWSNGHCPVCKEPVPMYEWVMDALHRPWKVQCPKCKDLFPKNDFQKFYASGLDAHNVFQPVQADRSLLFNAEHAGASDPLRSFGVDDGEGYVEGDHRWRFIGAYLIFGQWKQAIVNGIRNLAAAYLVTGNRVCAHKAGVLLDRVADLYPTFDFGKEGVMYEGPPRSGYVSTWHDACVEVHDLAMAYDAVFEELVRDEALVQFLAAKAVRFKLANPKSSFAHIQRNIEEGILRDTLANRPKIESNYPSTDVTIITIKTVLSWPGNQDEITAAVDEIITRGTAVDGLSGEKGIAGYSVIAPRNIADLLGRYARIEQSGLKSVLRRHPRLHDMYRFHLDTWCLGQYYPRTGDTGSFAERNPGYAALSFTRNPGIGPSSYSFLWDLYEATGDKDFVRLIYAGNGTSVEGLPYDLFAADPPALQRAVAGVIAQAGAAFHLGSVNKTQWCLAILRSGEGEQGRAAWLDYDSGERHGHADAMNLGLFAKGLDLLPDFGYPPVQFGGWTSKRAVWYTRSAAHNTVLVDGRDSRPGKGRTTLWFDGRQTRLVRAAAPELIRGEVYERTVALIDLSPADSYLIEVFRIVGGHEHIKFLHSHFGRVTTRGLQLEPAEESRFPEVMRNFQTDLNPAPGWSVDWTIEDRLKYLLAPKDLHLRYTDFTADAEAQLAEGWISVGSFGGTDETWIPRVLVRRRTNEGPLASTFVGLLEPYEGKSNLVTARRLELRGQDGSACPSRDVGLEIPLADGRTDVVLALGRENTQPAPGDPLFVECASASGATLKFAGEFCLVRCGADNKPQTLVLCNAASLTFGDLAIKSKNPLACLELSLANNTVQVAAGATEDLGAVEVRGAKLWPK